MLCYSIKIARIFLLLALCAILTACSSDRSSPESIAKAYVTAVYSGDGEAALACYNVAAHNQRQIDFLAENLVREASSSVKLVENCGGLSDVEILGVHQLGPSPDNLRVQIKSTFEDGTEVISFARVHRYQDEYFISMQAH